MQIGLIAIEKNVTIGKFWSVVPYGLDFGCIWSFTQ